MILRKPEWEKQPNEPNEWHEKFITYYLSQMGSRSIKTAVLNWAKANEVYRDEELTKAYSEWSIKSNDYQWLDREAAYDRYQATIIIKSEIENIKQFRDEGLKIVAMGNLNARRAIEHSGQIIEDYMSQVARTGEGKIDFEVPADIGGFDAAQWQKMVAAQRTAISGGDQTIEIGLKVLALDRMLEDADLDGTLIEAENEMDLIEGEEI